MCCSRLVLCRIHLHSHEPIWSGCRRRIELPALRTLHYQRAYPVARGVSVFTAPALGFPETARDGVCVADTVANTQASRSALCLKESLFIASPHAPGKLPRACTAATPTPTSRAPSASAGCWAASLAAQNKTQPTTDSCGIGPKVRLSRELSRLSPMTMICSLGT